MAKKEEHNHERGKIKKVISPPLLFFFGAFSSLLSQKKCVIKIDLFWRVGGCVVIYSLVSFSHFPSLLAQSPSYTLSSFLIY